MRNVDKAFCTSQVIGWELICEVTYDMSNGMLNSTVPIPKTILPVVLFA